MESHPHYGRVKKNKKEIKRLAKLKRQQKATSPSIQPEINSPPKPETTQETVLRNELKTYLQTNATNISTFSLFSNRKLFRIPPCLFTTIAIHPNILHLDLSKNEFKELPTAINLFTSLTHLNLSRNQLRKIPISISQLQNLQILNISSNDFRTIDNLQLSFLSLLPSLHTLNIQHCSKIGKYGSTDQQEITTRLGPSVNCSITQQLIPPEQKLHAADRDATLLKSQIAPHCTGALRRRLALVYGDTTNPEEVERKEVIERLLAAHQLNNGYGGQGGPRAARYIKGVPVDETRCEHLLIEMNKWIDIDNKRRLKPGEIYRERTNIKAQHYMILKGPKGFSTTEETKETKETKQTKQTKDVSVTSVLAVSSAAKIAATKILQHLEMWNQALALLATVDHDFSQRVTAIAFTKNFIGSCHIDTQNTGPFYGLALGDFVAPGGALCVEASAREVAHVDTRHRLGKVDGRFPHWVAPYQGNRYSVIYYQTRGEEIPRTFAVFQSKQQVPVPHVVLDPPTFTPTKRDGYYNCYDRTTGLYEPKDDGYIQWKKGTEKKIDQKNTNEKEEDAKKEYNTFPSNELEAIQRNKEMWHIPPSSFQECDKKMTQSSYEGRLKFMNTKHHGPVISIGQIDMNQIELKPLLQFLQQRIANKLPLSKLVKNETLGFPEYTNVQGEYNKKKQQFSTCNIQTAEHFRWIKTNVPNFIDLYQWVERRHLSLDILSCHFLYQDFSVNLPGTTDFNWHWDVGNAASTCENSRGLKIIRTVVVKLTEGSSAMQMAGLGISNYPECAGSFTDFRAECYHRSIVVNGTIHYKIAFFLGYR